MTRRIATFFCLAAIASMAVACAGARRPPAKAAGTPPPGVSMWVEPTDVAARDLFYGPWGEENAPKPTATYKLVQLKHTGVNLGMTVVDPDGREWSVKQPYPGGLDPEGPVEVVVSRLLSAAGYHQPPVYFLRAFNLKDDFGTHVEAGGRFRLKHPTLKEVSNWKWEDNPFIGRPEYDGLLVLLTMFNSTDLKNSNNSLYEHKDGDFVQHWYLSRDIGSALGDEHPIAPRKGNIDAFERVGFIKSVNNGYVQFPFERWYKKLVEDRITPSEVAWACNLLGNLSDNQMQDAFRAGGYDRATATRYIKKLREKIAEGRALGLRAARDDS